MSLKSLAKEGLLAAVSAITCRHSLEEGLEETLTLRLGVYGVLGRSLKTTNCRESVNALVEERCAKADHWKNSSQRQRWWPPRSWTSSRA